MPTKELSEKLQEAANWKAYVDQERGIATAIYSIVGVEKRIAGSSDEDAIRGYAFSQAYMRRLEGLSEAFKVMYESLSRHVTIREHEARIQMSGRHT
jgi:hypothetical protein